MIACADETCFCRVIENFIASYVATTCENKLNLLNNDVLIMVLKHEQLRMYIHDACCSGEL